VRPATEASKLASLAPWWLPVAIAVATILVYWPGLGGGFIFDDNQNLLHNPAIQVHDLSWQSWIRAMFSSPASQFQRPLSMLSFTLNFYFTGFDARAMKLTNLAIHASNAILAFALARQVLTTVAPPALSARVAAFVAAAWALHPINLMAVLYVVQRMESLSQVFVLAGILLYILGRQRQLRGEKGTLLMLLGLGPCTLLGLLAKESAALLPVYALLAEWALFGFRDARGARDRRLVAAFGITLVLPAVIGLAWLVPRVLSSQAWSIRGFTIGERLLTEARVVCDYLHWILVPSLRNLSLYHDDFVASRGLLAPPTTLLSLALLAALAGAAAWLRPRRPVAALGIAWFLASHLMTATIIPLELVFEHRNYFSSFGICLALADLLVLWPTSRRRRLGMLLAGTLLLFYAGTTLLRANEWRDPLRFAESEAAKHPASPRATYEEARMLILASGYDPASPYTIRARAAVERARRAPGADALPQHAALMLAARTHAPLRREWWQSLQRELGERPGKAQNQMALMALNNCAVQELCAFPPQDMVDTFNAALARGDDPGVLSIYGRYALHVLRDREFALRLWREAARLQPDNPQFLVNLAQLQMAMHQFDEAQATIAKLAAAGRFGQFQRDADRLSVQLAQARSQAGRG
jgi:hypothetical protein